MPDNIYLDIEPEEKTPVPPEELIAAAVGKNEMGLPQTKVGLFFEITDYGGNTLRSVREVSALDPIVSIAKNDMWVTVDLKFASKDDVYFSMMSDLMNETFKLENQFTDAQAPLITLCLIPEKYEARYYMLAESPAFWAITSTSPREELDTLRFVFADTDFYFLENGNDVLTSIAAGKAEVQAEEERKAEYYAQKEAERNERHI